jgi:cytochrome P450
VMFDTTRAVTLELILRVVFGVDDDARRAQFREAMVSLMAATASPAIAMFEATRRELGGFGPWSRFLRARARFDALVAEELALRRAGEPRDDVLGQLLAARDEQGEALGDGELRDQLHLLLFAGHDTTSTALAWAFWWLHRHPEMRERLLLEIDALGPDPGPEKIAALPYLEAVCKETLRIHPVVMNVARRAKVPLALAGWSIPAGSTVMVSSLMLHDREELYPEPRRFRPERFLERSFSPSEFVPFGGGARRCLGAALAMYEMKLVLAEMLRRRRLRLVHDREVRSVIRGLTMGPKDGIPMICDGPR